MINGRKIRSASIKLELIKKSKEAALTAVQIFNNPIIEFKAETFIVLMNIAWTYLFHAYFKDKNIEYRCLENHGKNRKYLRTKKGAYKYLSLENCLDSKNCPVDQGTIQNLKFLIGIRHEIEHKMTSNIDEYFTPYFQACCLNYNNYIKLLFGDKYGIDKHLTYSLQFSNISDPQKDLLANHKKLPQNLFSFCEDFDSLLSNEERSNQNFKFRIIYTPTLTSKTTSAHKKIEFSSGNSIQSQTSNIDQVVIKEIERKKYLPGEIVKILKKKGFSKFNMHCHILLWKEYDAKNLDKRYGVTVSKNWYYYESWLEFVLKHCSNCGNKYK